MAGIGASLLEQLLAADAGHRGPQAGCGAGHQTGFVSCRVKTISAGADAISSRQVVPLPPPAPLPDMLYIAVDGTGVPMVAAETEGRPGKGPDGRARTREVKLACLFTQATPGGDGRPVRDPGSSSYLATFEPPARFARLVDAEARRGAEHIRQLVVLGDGAVSGLPDPRHGLSGLESQRRCLWSKPADPLPAARLHHGRFPGQGTRRLPERSVQVPAGRRRPGVNNATFG
jgi:hypothetical protein